MKQNLSNKIKDQFKNGRVTNSENGKKGSEVRNKKWEKNPELKEQMKEKVRKAITQYKIEQYDKNTLQLIKT